jgi:hypothetical protein
MSIFHKHCHLCGEIFDSELSFYAHRVGRGQDRRCLSTAEMIDGGLAQKDGGIWFKQYQKLTGNAAALKA